RRRASSGGHGEALDPTRDREWESWGTSLRVGWRAPVLSVATSDPWRSSLSGRAYAPSASSVVANLPSKPAGLPPLALDGGDEAVEGRAERLGQVRLGRGGGRRPELPVGVDEDGLRRSRDRGAAHPGQERPDLVRIADPNRPRLAGLAGVRDIDVVRAGRELGPRVGADPDVRVAGGVFVERLIAKRRVVVAPRVAIEREGPGGGVLVALLVAAERAAAGRDVGAAGRVLVEGTLAARGVRAAGGVPAERVDAGGDVGAPTGVRGERRRADRHVAEGGRERGHHRV